MIYNVAQLLKSSVGTSMEEDIHEEELDLDDDLKVVGPVDGHVRIRRISQCLLVDGEVDLNVELNCARCLTEVEEPIHVTFAERYYPTLDIVSGLPLPSVDEEEVFTINDHHEIDLSEAIRQHVLLHIPMVTLCKEDCAGLCLRCGHDLNLGPCGCEPEIDERLSTLSSLLQKNEDMSHTHE